MKILFVLLNINNNHIRKQNLKEIFDNQLGRRFVAISKSRPFTYNEQLLLCEKICTHLYENELLSRPNQHSVFENIVEQITEIFPLEKPNGFVYYHKEKGKNAIYNKVYLIISTEPS